MIHISNECFIQYSIIDGMLLQGITITKRTVNKPSDIFTWIDKDHIIFAIGSNHIFFNQDNTINIKIQDNTQNNIINIKIPERNIPKTTYIGKYDKDKNLIHVIWNVSEKEKPENDIEINLNNNIRKI